MNDYLIGAAPDPDEDDAADERRSSNMTIKCSLKKLVCLPGDDKANFIKHVSEIVAVMSKLRVRACQTLTLFFIHTLSDPRRYSDDFFGSIVQETPAATNFGGKLCATRRSSRMLSRSLF